MTTKQANRAADYGFHRCPHKDQQGHRDSVSGMHREIPGMVMKDLEQDFSTRC